MMRLEEGMHVCDIDKGMAIRIRNSIARRSIASKAFV